MKFWLYLYLESEKSGLEILIAKGLLKLAVLVFRLPGDVQVSLMAQAERGDFKGLLRRIWWLINVIWLQGRSQYDRYFDFSIGLSSAAARSIFNRVRDSSFAKRAESEFDYNLVLAQLASARIVSELEVGATQSVEGAQIREIDEGYERYLNRAMIMLPEASLPGEVRAMSSLTSMSQHDTLLGHLSDVTHQPDSPENTFSRLATEVFRSFVRLMREEGVTVFAVCGTLLGIIREDRLLPHDSDIDMGIFDADLDGERFKEILSRSEEFYIKQVDYPAARLHSTDQGVVYSRQRVPSLFKIGSRKAGIHIDLFTHFAEQGLVWHGSTLHRWDNSPFTLRCIEFAGMKVNIPADTDRYLTENYGTWQVPVTKYNCSTGARNIGVSANPNTLCYYVKCCYDQKDGDNYSFLIQKLKVSGLVKTEEKHLILA